MLFSVSEKYDNVGNYSIEKRNVCRGALVLGIANESDTCSTLVASLIAG